MKTCKICGSPLANNKRKYCCEECRQEGDKMRDHDGYKVARWTAKVKKSEKRLDEKVKKASQHNMSYGRYVALEYLEKIRSEQNG